ncbi:MAG TPA: twin-arginine translocase TatA/TatE family subunit [Candidatus Limnocylindrales bacterium]|nr:twin-arginine translocase TatA/TatE family subunit [Candidatus Limnocylindrales bacterium]
MRRAKMLSMPHLVIIFLVALIVFGPEKLPELARNFGKVMAEFKRATNDLRSGFEEHMRELERETRISDARKPYAPAASRASPSDTVTQAGTLPGPTLSATSGAEPEPAAENTILAPPDSIVAPDTPDAATVTPSLELPFPEQPSPEGLPKKASDGHA